MTHVPLGGSVFDADLSGRPRDRTNRTLADYYEVDHQAIEALGLHLVAGRAFRPDEILPPLDGHSQSTLVHGIIVTQAFANALFPEGHAIA